MAPYFEQLGTFLLCPRSGGLPVLVEVVFEEGGHLVIVGGAKETPKHVFLLHGQIKNGGI